MQEIISITLGGMLGLPWSPW